MNPSFIHVHCTVLILPFQDALFVIGMALWGLGGLLQVENNCVSVILEGQLATTSNPSFSESNILLWPQIHMLIYTVLLPHILISKTKRKWEWSFENILLAEKIPCSKKQPNEVTCEPPILTADCCFPGNAIFQPVSLSSSFAPCHYCQGEHVFLNPFFLFHDKIFTGNYVSIYNIVGVGRENSNSTDYIM